MLGIFLTSCSAMVSVQETPRSFHPYISDVSPTFQVIDHRPTASRTSRHVDSSWYYGDEQFFPSPVQVVADRFAQEFPKAQSQTVLVITELELRYDLAKVGDYGPCFLIDCFFTQNLAKGLNRRRNVVSAQLSGTFDGVAFRNGYRAEYVDHVPDRQENRVLSALQAVIDKALTDVRERRENRVPRGN